MPECKAMLEYISAHLDGALTPEEEALLAGHLAQCPACRDLLSDLEEIHGALGALAHAPAAPPPELSGDIMAQIRGEQVLPIAPPQRSASRWRSWAAMAAVFAVVLLGVGTRQFWSGGDRNESTGGAALPPAAMSGAGAADAAAPRSGTDAGGEESSAFCADPGEGVQACDGDAPQQAKNASGPDGEDAPAAGESGSAGQAPSAVPFLAVPSMPLRRSANVTESPAHSSAPVSGTQAPEPSCAPQIAVTAGEGGAGGIQAYCGVLTLPWEQAGALDALDYTVEGDQRLYCVPADTFEALAASLEGTQSVALDRSGADIDADQGLVIVTGVPPDMP